MSVYDTIVLGLGGMGSAAAYYLAAQGNRTLGLEQFTPAHKRGSSHGGTRIIRSAYEESPDYVPLVWRATQLWRELEQQTGTTLLTTTGGLMIGHIDGELVTGSLASARHHDLPYELLSAGDMQRRYPLFHVDPDEVAVYDPSVGFLRPEACVQAFVQAAQAHGAELHFEEPVRRWTAHPDGITVETANGRYHAARMIICAGAWTSTLLPELAEVLEVERIPVFWFRPRANADAFDVERFPIFMWERDDVGLWYGFPRLEGMVKVALHHQGRITSADALDREVHAEEVAALRAILERYLPTASGDLGLTSVCMYTNSPDQHFIIDRNPAYPHVVVAAGC